MRKASFLCSLGIVCWLFATAGCQGRRPGGDAASDSSEATETENVGSPRAASERMGRFRREPPGRGLGRTGRSEAGAVTPVQYPPLELTPTEASGLDIATAKAGFRAMRAAHSALGKVVAPQPRMAKVSYPFPARIASIHVKIGDWVKQGQPVLTVQSEEVGRAKSGYYKAIAGLELAKQNYEREKRLFDRGVGAQKNTLTAEAELKVAQVNLDAAEKTLHVLGFSEEDVQSIAHTHQIRPEMTVLAPISGRVIEHNAVLGSMIDQATDLMTIMDPTLLWVNAEIFERDIAKIRIGQEVQITVLAYPGEVFRGKISYIGEVMDPETRTMSVRTEVKNPDFKLKPGMFADVTIILNGARNVLTVPTEAVLQDNDQDIVFVKTGNQYTARAVTVSGQENGYLGIAEGLRGGEEIVIRNAYLLKSKLYGGVLREAGVH